MDISNYPKRKSPRLKDYDYSQSGAYFITICTQHRIKLFGAVGEDGIMSHNAAGLVLFEWWDELINKYDHIDLDGFVVMPNHIHGIICLHDTGRHAGLPLQQIVQWYKTMTTNAYISGVKESGWLAFSGKVWQRSYHDHIIRSERGLNHLRNYIYYNPAQWAADTYYTD